MSGRGQTTTRVAARTASTDGAITVEEYGYGLGPPTGILVLRYPRGRSAPDFPAHRDDFLHQVFWSPDGVLGVRRGGTARFLSPGDMLWVRRGALAEVRGLQVQTVLRVCVRAAPPALEAHETAVLSPGAAVGADLLGIARPGVAEDAALDVRRRLLDALASSDAVTVDHRGCGSGPAAEVARALLRDPADPTSLAGWADRLHVSAKTLQRDFERAFAMTFSAWRTRTRLHAAVAMLPDASVTEVARRVGYSTTSAFVAAFTRELGTSPGRFVA